MAIALCLGVFLAAPMAVTKAAAQDECEVPLFVKQASGGANLMILADNSGSMNAAVFHDDYNPKQIWSGEFENNRTYYVAKDGMYSPADFNSQFDNQPDVYMVNSDNGEDGWYDGNYLNWIYFYATEFQRTSVPSVTRVQILKTVLYDIIDRSEQLNMGLTLFSKTSDGGNIVGPDREEPRGYSI